MARLLVDASLLSQGKLDTATILESFNYGDPQEKLRVRMVPAGDTYKIDSIEAVSK